MAPGLCRLHKSPLCNTGGPSWSRIIIPAPTLPNLTCIFPINSYFLYLAKEWLWRILTRSTTCPFFFQSGCTYLPLWVHRGFIGQDYKLIGWNTWIFYGLLGSWNETLQLTLTWARTWASDFLKIFLTCQITHPLQLTHNWSFAI